ncbi:hypothetical protein ONS96_013410 [Cadophora gregata f. sp. sojae]|nr:hypothetical protein ONS96_013410 [Cadophora gregata f. sp. sojae]
MATTTDLQAPKSKHQHHMTPPPSPTSSKSTYFPILSLPLELRLKIYSYILPPRHHKIVTSLPSTNFFYNTSASSFLHPPSYPFGRSAPLSPTGKPLTVPYKVLTSNTHASYPHNTITTALLQTCKQIYYEAEPVLYGSSEAVWDFGVHLDAVRGFWAERSQLARECVRSLRVAWECPAGEGIFESGSGGEILGRKVVVWMRFVEYLRNELKGLRELDLMLWCADGGVSGFPKADEEIDWDVNEDLRMPVREYGLSERDEMALIERKERFETEKKWREWRWTEDLLSMPSLRQTKITCWAAVPPKMEETVDFSVTVPKFDSWVAGRMVADSILRAKMVQDGIVVSEEVAVLGSTTSWMDLRGLEQ